MVNKPKAIGTAGESAVVRYLVAHGFPHAERRALHGGFDKGDVTGIPGLCIEVKSGEVAKSMHPGLVIEWLKETEVERFNSRSDIGLLVMQRRGFGMTRVSEWWTLLPSKFVISSEHDPDTTVVMTFGAAVSMLRMMGYGESDAN